MDQPTPAAEDPLLEQEKSLRSAKLIVFLVVFIDLLGFGIVLPLLPLYASNLLHPLFSDNMARGAVLGVLMSSFSLMQFLFAPMWGRLSDRYGRRPILLLGLAGSVVFYALFGVASLLMDRPALALGLMFVARIGAGIAGATIPTAQAVIADTTPPDRRRASGMALIGMAFGIGFTFGPLLGFTSRLVDSRAAPGFAASLLSLFALFLAWRRMPETLRTSSPHAERRLFDWGGFRSVLSMPTIGILVLTFFLATFAFGGLESTLALVNQFLLEGHVSRDLPTLGESTGEMERINFLVFAYVGLVLTLVQGVLYRRMVQRVGEVTFLRLGLVLMTLGLGGAVLVLLVMAPNAESRTPVMLAAMAVFTMAVTGFAFLTPSLQALISRRSDPTRQGEVLGVNQSAAALARILGPLTAVMLFFATPCHVLPYAFGVALLAVVFVLSLRIRADKT